MLLQVFDNGEKYNAMKLDAYDSISFSPSTGVLIFFEKGTGEIILEWQRVKSLEMKIGISGWNLILHRVPDLHLSGGGHSTRMPGYRESVGDSL